MKTYCKKCKKPYAQSWEDFKKEGNDDLVDCTYESIKKGFCEKCFEKENSK